MQLLIGGRAQGKIDIAMNRYPLAEVLDEKELYHVIKIYMHKEQPESKQESGAVIWNHLHLAMKMLLENGEEPEKIWEGISSYIDLHPDSVIVCDEIGNGIVPIEREERRWREETGRLLCKIAKRAECVERVLCGLPERIK